MNDPVRLYGTPTKRSARPKHRGSRRVKVKKKIAKRMGEIITDRRLGLWRKVIDPVSSEKRVVYVTLSGEAIRPLGAALKAQNVDVLALGGDGVWPVVQASIPVIRRCATGRGLEVPRYSSDPLNLGYWGIPPAIVNSYAVNARITALFPWQAECLEACISKPSNFQIYTAPTSGGKSIVAEILLLRRLLYQGQRALWVAPFVSICREKFWYFRRVWGVSGIRVEEFHGGVTETWSEGVDVGVCTIEKANSLYNRVVTQAYASSDSVTSSNCACPACSRPLLENLEIGTVVIDELHAICTDESRGYLIEGLLVKMNLLKNSLCIGMSATLPELPRISKWLSAEVHTGNFRPVKLDFSVKLGRRRFAISDSECSAPLSFVEYPVPTPEDPDSLGSVVFEVDGPVIVFCQSKAWAEQCANLISRLVPVASHPQLAQLIAALRLTPGGESVSRFSHIFLSGVGFHHAGLTVEQRSLIELAFRAGHLKILCATTTLSAGVNLPARRVVIRSVGVLTGFSKSSGGPGNALARERLLQMAGRAGRTGFGLSGDAVVFVKDRTEAEWIRKLLIGQKSQAAVCQSCREPQLSPPTACTCPPIGFLNRGARVLKLILETIGISVIKTQSELTRKFLRAILFPMSEESLNTGFRYLLDNHLIAIEGKCESDGSDCLALTALGEAVAFCAFEIEEASGVFQRLREAAKCLKLEANDFQLVTLCVPSRQEVPTGFDSVGLVNSFATDDGELGRAVRAESGKIKSTGSGSSRLFFALALHSLLTADISQVSRQFNLPLGTLQTLQASATSTCGMLVAACERLRWWSLAAALGSLLPRLQLGVSSDLVELAAIDQVFPARAKALKSAGIDTVEKLANSSVLDVALIFGKIAPVEKEVVGQLKELKKAASRAVYSAASFLLRA